MRPYKVSIDKDALADISEISGGYNRRVKNLGLKFEQHVKRNINRLKTSPYSHGIRYGNIRYLFLKKFPFLIHYKIDEENHLIIVFAIIHTSRNPKAWEERTNDV